MLNIFELILLISFFPEFKVYSAFVRSRGLETRFHQQLLQSRRLHLTIGCHWVGQVNVSGNRILL